MITRPIHENLDTSFVNLSALLRYLRRREFVGKINIELSGYEAEIFLTGAGEIKAREHDRIAGRIAEGEEALQRLLIRAREPGGIINVFQAANQNEKKAVKKETKITPQNATEIPKLELPKANGNPFKTQTPPKINTPPRAVIQAKTPSVEISVENINAKPAVRLPDFPFKLTNKVEEKARRINLAPQHWQTLLDVTGEILGKIDRTLSAAKLDFKAAFKKACSEIADDYPFLADANNFSYKDGKITMREQTGAPVFVSGIFEALRRILEKLGKFPQHANAHRKCLENLAGLNERRRRFHDKFTITPQIERIIKS